jgi:hypothetical protein
MDAKALKKIADQLDEVAALFTALSGSFRTAAGGGEGEDGDGKAGGKPAKSAPGKGGKGKPKEEEKDDEVTEDSLRERLKELAATKGKDAMADVLAKFDAERLPDVDEDDYAKLNDAITEAMEAEDEAEDEAPDFKALTKRFKKLDAKAQKAVLKACGVKAFGDIDEDDEDEVKELAEALDDAE